MKTNQADFYAKEMEGLRNIVSDLWDENQEAFNALFFIKDNYRQWAEILVWLKRNGLKGQALADLFKNESDDSGSGYHLGVAHIISRMEGSKYNTRNLKVDELL